AEAGLAAVTWPAEVGGRGQGPIEQVTVNQEIERAGVPGILDVIGIGMLGPCLIAHGSDEQRSRYLGPMLHGDEVWCQMFSEPGAGSDLAAVQTRARQNEDGGWTLNGQKVWTTNAQFAAHGLLLARTDADVPKHKGMTMFIVPMDARASPRAGCARSPARRSSTRSSSTTPSWPPTRSLAASATAGARR
ncbi:MAG: acyl-CoA dehydrogenase family protein, partial [Actinomycetota bacterium]|nr:acyl-CoA dehydrogenase family protein [Actinomycetota bacterium]